LFVNKGGRKFLVASHEGQGFVVNEDDCVGNTRKGKQVLKTSRCRTRPARSLTVSGDTVRGDRRQRKKLLFRSTQVPEMATPAAASRLTEIPGWRAVRRHDFDATDGPGVERFGGPRFSATTKEA